MQWYYRHSTFDRICSGTADTAHLTEYAAVLQTQHILPAKSKVAIATEAW